MENDRDWKLINSSTWNCDVWHDLVMEKTVPYGSVLYKNSLHTQEEKNESFA